MAKKPQEPNNEALYTSFGEDNVNLHKHTLPDDIIVVGEQKYPSKFTNAERAVADRVSTRSGYNKADYLKERPEQKLPTGHSAIIATCQAMYKKVGMIRNIVDLMSDFSAEGLEIKHPIKSHERFYRSWAKRTDLASRAHDFMKLMLRDGNVVVRRLNAILPPSMTKEMSKAAQDMLQAEASCINVLGLTSLEEAVVPEEPEVVKKRRRETKKREIPWRYTFISPVILEKIGGTLGKFFNANDLAIKIDSCILEAIRSPKTNAEKKWIAKLPREIVVAAQNNRTGANQLVALNPEKTYVDYYKKDDWEDWGTPFLYGILEDVMLKEKMKLADLAALDGVINVTRIWKLGDHKEKILPSPAAVNRLLNILQYNVGGGQKDIVWDSMIDMVVEYPPLDKILGDEKYKAVNRDIMKGLGIPEALVGGVDLATRNAETAFVQLKTLIERLEYVRSRCIRWLNNEFALVAEAMGFKTVPTISFETMSLRDEAAEKQLMIQLVDRGIVSDQAIHEIFGLNFATELQRIREEQKIRDKDPKILEKTNPYYRSVTQLELQHQFQVELQKLKQGSLDRGGGDNPNGDQSRDVGDNEPGRPSNRRETGPRDRRTERTLSVYKVMADEILSNIDKIVDPLYLEKHKAKNMRALTKGQTNELEGMKFAILAAINQEDKVTQELIYKRTSSEYDKIVGIFNESFNDMLVRHAEILGRQPNARQRRSLAASTWAVLRCEK